MADSKVRPFLMFEGKAEEAMNFYVSLFSGAKVLDILRYGPNQAGTEGSVMKASFSIGDLTLMCTDSVVEHGFSFTPSTANPTKRSPGSPLHSLQKAALS